MNHTRLNTEMPLPSFVTVAVIAVLTCICINIKVDARALSDDPWPFWGRTVERVGYTDTIGPQTPTIDWFILISTFYEDNDLTSSCTMDSEARLFVGVRNGLVVVDTVTREIAWEDLRGNRVGQTPALWSGYVLWGYSREGTSFVCSDAATGSEIWLIDEPAVG